MTEIKNPTEDVTDLGPVEADPVDDQATGSPPAGWDEDAHAEGRRRDIPGWHEIGWDHVERMRAEFRPVGAADLTLDAVDPLDGNLAALTALMG